MKVAPEARNTQGTPSAQKPIITTKAWEAAAAEVAHTVEATVSLKEEPRRERRCLSSLVFTIIQLMKASPSTSI